MSNSVRRRTIASFAVAMLLASTAWAIPQVASASEATGSIVGTVVGDDVSFGGAKVTAYRYEGGVAGAQYTAEVSPTGAYALSDLPPGVYRVGFMQDDYSAPGLTSWTEWWSDATSRAAGADLVVDPGVTLSGIDADVESVGDEASYPAISGTPVVGKELTADSGAWPAGTVLSYEWYADDEHVANSDGPTFTPTADLLGTHLSVVVYGAIDAFGAHSSTEYQYKASYETSMPVGRGTLTSAVPAISGSPTVGSKLTAKALGWTKGTTFAYQWYAAGARIEGATKATYTVSSAVTGKSLTVTVKGGKDGYTSATKTSQPTLKVTRAGTPSVKGVARVGAELTAHPGTWASGTAMAFQWYANGKAIANATKKTFRASAGVAGRVLSVKVTGTKKGYATASGTSKVTAKVTLAGTPAIAGKAQVGKRLTATPGRWTSGMSFSYRWYANGKAIANATKTTYTPSSGTTGKRITVKVTGKRTGFATVTTTSKATAKVASVPSSSPKPAAGKASPISRTSCPASHPIKGNQTTRHSADWIYHVPGGQYYAATHPEECFATERDAKRAGYRASMR